MTDAPAPSVKQLVAELDSKNGVTRMKARASLVSVGSAAVAALCSALDSPKQHVRWEAAKALTSIADPAALDPLVAALGDEDADVRWVVSEALIALRGKAVTPLLSVLAKMELPDHAYSAVHHVLKDLAQEADAAPLVKPVVDAFEAPERPAAMALAARRSLGG